MSSVGRQIHGRALLDNGSQRNFITSNLVHKLGLKRQKVNIPICGIRESKNNIKYKLSAIVQSLDSSHKKTIEFLVLSKITDPSFNHPGNIDVLIGGKTYWDIICAEKLKIKEGPYLQRTLFGWVVKHQYELLDDKIELFWKMEELPSKHIFTDEQKLYLTHFSENVYQNEDGKSIVKLPFKYDNLKHMGCIGNASGDNQLVNRKQ
ncbi:uncharacterized protein LOC112681192 [Sipha flava]|uniref:Uncharacterized protein LOC112681192 n=1 Tax=Sipha flava TaxID=143950 RepID=A0A8B8F8S2_9HEMI|nr:uncharacterized protein LOC112681192 [Sipha flava]